MKKKNGFTLIELIVTIALILSVMVLAIIGFNNISKSKKEESFEIVKKTIESAATDYITSNKYLLETLSPNSDTVKVTLGTLVAEDYLDKVTSPITGEPLDRCSIVSITKNNGGYDYNFDNNIMEDCDNTNNNQIVEITDELGPSLTITPIGVKGSNGWYKINSKALNKSEDNIISDKEKEVLGIKLQIDAIDKKSSLNSGIQILDNTTGNWKNLSSSIYVDDGEEVVIKQLTAYDTRSYATTVENKKTCYKVTNIDGLSTTKCKTYSVDTDAPTCHMKIIGGHEVYNGKDAYYSLPPFQPIIPITYTDIGSGIANKKYSYDNTVYWDYISPLVANILNLTLKEKAWYGSVNDNAGNNSRCNVTANVFMKSVIDGVLNSTEYCADAEGESTIWTKGNRTITQNYKTLAGDYKGNSGSVTFTTEGKTGTITSPGHPSCIVNTYIDRTPPTIDRVDVSKARLVQKDINGNTIQDREITINGSNGNYNARICLINKAGSFGIYGYTTYAKDNLSEIDSSTWQTSESWYSEHLKTNISPGCLRTKDENPCIKTVIKSVSDKAGNKGTIATYKFEIGYKDNGSPGHHYESWCDNW